MKHILSNVRGAVAVTTIADNFKEEYATFVSEHVRVGDPVVYEKRAGETWNNVSVEDMDEDKFVEFQAFWIGLMGDEILCFVEDDNLFKKRNWRNAWNLENGEMTIPLELAKVEHKKNMIAVCTARLPKHEALGKPLEADVLALYVKIQALDWNVSNLTELYTLWVPEFDTRNEARTYNPYKER